MVTLGKISSVSSSSFLTNVLVESIKYEQSYDFYTGKCLVNKYS